MNLVSSSVSGAFLSGITNLWDTFQKNITVVKEPTVTATVDTTNFVPGYGPQSNESNYTYTPVSGVYSALVLSNKPEGFFDEDMEKALPGQVLYLKVQQTARDFIMDGRANLHVVYLGKTYNFDGEERPTEYLGRKFYYFKVVATQ